MAIGAYLGTVITPLLLIGVICIVTVFVALGKISGRLIYFYLFGISLGLVWQTTMLGVDVVGSDIHNEFYFAKLNSAQGWDLLYPDAVNSSIVIGLFAPWISRLLMLDMVWVFKAILTLFLAGVPLVLFAAFKKMFGEKRAYFATLFFVIVPVYSMEIAQIAKSMVAELFFALMFYAMVSDWRWPYKLAGIGGSLVMAVLCHYTIGILGICFLLAVVMVRLVSIPIKWGLVANRKVPLAVLAISLAMGIGTFWGWHGYTANASGVRSVVEVAESISAPYMPSKHIPPADIPSSPEGIPSVDVDGEPAPPPQVKPFTERMNDRQSLVRLGTGFDFGEVPIGGKLFRAVQYLTQFLIIVGGFWLVFAYKRYNVSAEYVGLVAASGILLLACVFVPGISVIINMTRFFHISLFFLAPMLVLGVEALTSIRKAK